MVGWLANFGYAQHAYRGILVINMLGTKTS